MKTRTILTVFLATIAILGLIYYSYDDVFSSEAPEGFDENTSNNMIQETEDGQALGEEREIKGRNGSENQDNESQVEEKDGIVNSSRPVAGEKFRIVVYDEGDRVTAEPVYLDGENIGETSNTGALTFEVSNVPEITLAVAGFEESFDVSVNREEPRIDITQPKENSQIQLEQENSEINFAADIFITEQEGTARISLNNEEINTQSLEAGENSLNIAQPLEPGKHTWTINVQTEQFKTEKTASFQVTEPEIKEGLELRNKPVADEWNTVMLYQEGDPIEGEEIFVNSESIGTTNEFGELKFQIPDTEEITITTASGLDEITRTVEEYSSESPVEINVLTPNETSIDDYKTRFEWAVEAEDQGFDTKLVLDGQTRFTETVSSNSSGFQQELVMEDSGTHKWRVEVTQNSQTYSTEDISFETLQDAPKPTIDVSSPDEGEVFDDHRITFDFDVNSVYPYNATVSIDGFEVQKFRQEDADQIPQPVIWGVKQGQSQVEIDYSSDVYSGQLSKTVNFETNSERPIAYTVLREPLLQMRKSYAEVQSPFVYKFNIDAYETVDYELIASRDGQNKTLESGQLEKGKHIIEDEISLEPGTYDLFVRVSSGQTQVESNYREVRVH